MSGGLVKSCRDQSKMAAKIGGDRSLLRQDRSLKRSEGGLPRFAFLLSLGALFATDNQVRRALAEACGELEALEHEPLGDRCAASREATTWSPSPRSEESRWDGRGSCGPPGASFAR
ncbi:unnamed protein product [Durusdinium trenchii]|uniref:Uncharacterized protein n=1 Tax=Durusdinium trenchii TaxID=1381693 RepID=A0ABP0HZE3_9DINO